MSTVEALLACTCGTIGASAEVRLCVECHRYWRGDKELLGVSKVLRATWPFKPDYSAAKPEVLENARDRGIAVDVLFTSYLRGQLQTIPRGTRADAVDLFFRLKRWWDGRQHGEVKAQALLADNAVAGTCDVIDDGYIYDLKTTYDVEPMYGVQLGAYGQLYWETFKEPVKGLGIIHLTKRYAAPKIIKLDMHEAISDWTTLRSTYEMALRRSAQ